MNTDETLLLSTTQLIDFKQEKTWLSLTWDDGYTSKYHYMWLRDNCPQSQELASKQRIVETADIPVDIHPEHAQINDSGALEITWSNDGHTSRFDADWLQEHCYSNGSRKLEWEPKLWNATSMSVLPEADYKEVSTNDAALRDWLAMVSDHGFAILRNVPTEDKMVLKIANMFGFPRKTAWFWGKEHFDVKLDPNISHLGYTSLPLLLHTDDSSFDPAPTHLLLHCLIADTEGGETVLADGFKLATDLREQEPEKFKLLSQNLLSFKYKDEDKDFAIESPVISLNERGEVKAMRYSNHITQPFNMAFDKMEAYYEAYRTFAEMRSASTYQIKFRLKPGDFYIVDNYRVLHGRDAFSKTGNRILQGCYVERGDLMSKLRILSREQ